MGKRDSGGEGWPHKWSEGVPDAGRLGVGKRNKREDGGGREEGIEWGVVEGERDECRMVEGEMNA